MLGYVVAHWRGQLSLGKSYWLNGVLIGAVLGLCVGLLSLTPPVMGNPTLALAMNMVVIVYTAWALVGVWRSAGETLRKGKLSVPPEPRFLPYLARVMVGVGLAQSIWTLGPVTHDLVQVILLRQSDIGTQYSIQMTETSDIALVGYINPSSVDAVLEHFKQPDRRFLIISSAGGMLTDAFRLADLVREREIMVVTEGACASSCLLVLAASPRGAVIPGTQLLFHNPQPAVTILDADAKAVIANDLNQYYERFLTYGASADFISRMKAQSETPLGLREAAGANIIKLVWDEGEESFLPVDEYCRQHECP